MPREFTSSSAQVAEACDAYRIVCYWRQNHPTEPISAALPPLEEPPVKFNSLERAATRVVNASTITPIFEYLGVDLELYHELIRGQLPDELRIWRADHPNDPMSDTLPQPGKSLSELTLLEITAMQYLGVQP